MSAPLPFAVAVIAGAVLGYAFGCWRAWRKLEMILAAAEEELEIRAAESAGEVIGPPESVESSRGARSCLG